MAKIEYVAKLRYSMLLVIFLFVGDVNAHREKWFKSSTTTLQGRAARDFASSLGCEQLVTDPTHVYGVVLDLVLTDNPDLLRVRPG